MKKHMNVEGMHCAGCSGRLKRILEALPEVESAAADHEAGTADVVLKSDISDEALKTAIENGGFTLKSVENVA